MLTPLLNAPPPPTHLPNTSLEQAAAQLFLKVSADSDIIITTALIPGRPVSTRAAVEGVKGGGQGNGNGGVGVGGRGWSAVAVLMPRRAGDLVVAGLVHGFIMTRVCVVLCFFLIFQAGDRKGHYTIHAIRTVHTAVAVGQREAAFHSWQLYSYCCVSTV